MCRLRIIKMKGKNTAFSVLLCLVNSKTNSSETVENLLMQNTECMKSSQANVDTPQGQSLKETGAHEETTSDHRNVGTWTKERAQRRSCPRPGGGSAQSLPARPNPGSHQKTEASVGPLQPFWFIEQREKEREQRGRKHLLSNATRCWPFRSSISFMLHNKALCPFHRWRNRGWWSHSWSCWPYTRVYFKTITTECSLC